MVVVEMLLIMMLMMVMVLVGVDLMALVAFDELLSNCLNANLLHLILVNEGSRLVVGHHCGHLIAGARCNGCRCGALS